MKEIKFTRCFINGKKSGVASYDNSTARVLFFSQSLGVGLGVDDLRAAGVSLHQFNNSIVIPSADAAGVQAVLPGAVVEWEGSKEYNARCAAAVGTRGGSASSAAPTAPTAGAAPAVGGSFVCPAVDDVPAVVEVCKMMPALRPEYNAAGKEFAAALVVGASDDLEISSTEKLTAACAFAPAVGDALKIYGGVIRGAWSAWVDAEKKRREEEEKRRKEEEEKRVAAEAAAAAAADGKTLVTLPDGSTVAISGKPHKDYATVMQLVKLGDPVYMWGPAGTGKSYAAKQVAEALGLEYYPISKIDDIYTMLQGSPGLDGKLMETAFYKAAVNGGVVNLDEIDRSNPAALDWLLGSLSARCATFPVVGRVDFHKDFIVVATGNTCGTGATADYQTSNYLDPAFRRRFSFVPVGYDPAIDAIAAGSDSDLLDFCQAVREFCGRPEISITLTVSPKEIERLHKYADIFEPAKNLEFNLLKGLERDTINQIARNINVGGRWLAALKKLAA